MRLLALLIPLVLIALPASSETLQCRVVQDCAVSAKCTSPTTTIAFSIDRNQFAAPVDLRDPPRRKITQVRIDDTVFAAEPILMQHGKIRGFWADFGPAGSHVLTARTDGAAIYTGPGDTTHTGTCREVG